MMRLIWIGLCLTGALLLGLRELDWLTRPWPLPLVDRDFANLWSAGRLAWTGDIATIFDHEAFTKATRKLAGTTFSNSYSYPPHALFLAMPFGILSFGPALIAWSIVSLAAFVWAARPLLPPELPRWVLIASPATLICLQFGHYGLICGALWMLAFRGHGLAAAALTIKPHLGLFLAVRMLAEKRALAAAILGTLALMGLSAAVFGLASWQAFLTDNLSYHVGLLDNQARFEKNMVTAFVTYGLAGQLFYAAAALILLARRFDVFTAATATFLVLPYGFHYDLTVVTLGFAVLLASRWNDLPSLARVPLLLGFLIPALTAFGGWLAPPILLACLYIQTRYPLERIEGVSFASAWPGLTRGPASSS